MRLQTWKRPSNYIGAQWDGWLVFLGRNRDSGCLENSNFETALELVKVAASKDPVPGDEDESATVIKVCENHWACGWVEWIAIHPSDKAAVAEAEAILDRLESYAVLDENDLSERENSEADTVWRDCYGVKERLSYVRRYRSQFEFSSLSDMLGCIRGRYFAGYASELIDR